MIVALGFPLNVAAIILGCIFSTLLSVFNALGPISNPTPPTAALTEFFHADTVASDQPLPVSWYLISSECVYLCSCIRDSVEDRQSRIAWQTINEVSRRKNTAKAKLKAANQQERIKLWKQHFENLLGNPPKITHEPITRIISKQLDIKLGPFTQEELDSVLRKIKNRKAAGLDEIPPEVWKTRQFDDILLRHCNAV